MTDAELATLLRGRALAFDNQAERYQHKARRLRREPGVNNALPHAEVLRFARAAQARAQGMRDAARTLEMEPLP
ncbi:MAG: hypothetical protein AB7M12_00605 [Hyphomonadaceae bacterium]